MHEWKNSDEHIWQDTKETKWKGIGGVELEQIKEVVEVKKDRAANRLLGEEWILLAVGVVQLGNKEGSMQGGAYYILGRKKAV